MSNRVFLADGVSFGATSGETILIRQEKTALFWSIAVAMGVAEFARLRLFPATLISYPTKFHLLIKMWKRKSY